MHGHAHAHILLSRLYRYIAQSTTGNAPTALSSTLKEAKLAVHLLGDRNTAEEFQTLQNLAVMHGFAYNKSPQNHADSELEYHNLLVQLLNFDIPDPEERYDLIRMGHKWCKRHENFWRPLYNKLPAEPPILPFSGWKSDQRILHKFGLFWESAAPTSHAPTAEAKKKPKKSTTPKS